MLLVFHSVTWLARLRSCLLGTALLLLVLGIGLPAAISALSLEFTSREVEETFLSTVFISLVAAPFLLLAGLLLRPQGGLDVAMKLLFCGVLLVVLYFGMAIAAFSGMCLWTTEETLFVSRTDPATTIARRSIGCGAVDSGPPGHGTFQITRWPPCFICATRIDTSQLDFSEWRRAGIN